MSQNAWPERELWARVPVLAIASDVEAKPCIDRRVSSCQKTCVHVCVCRSSYAMNDMRYKFFRFAIFLSKKCKTIKKSFRGRFGFIWRNSSLCGSDQAIAFRLMTRWMDGWMSDSVEALTVVQCSPTLHSNHYQHNGLSNIHFKTSFWKNESLAHNGCSFGSSSPSSVAPLQIYHYRPLNPRVHNRTLFSFLIKQKAFRH